MIREHRATVRRVLAGVAVTALLLTGACQRSSEDTTAALTARIEHAIASHVNDGSPVRAVLAVVDGDTVVERYYDSSRDDYRDAWSVTKSVVSALVGIAIDEGYISGVDATLAALLPAYADAMSPQVAAVTLRQLLTMTSGIPAEFGTGSRAFETSADPVRTILGSFTGPPGHFAYTNAGAQLVAAILQTATGMTALEYAGPRLFDPLGIPHTPETPLLMPEDLLAYESAGFSWPVDHAGFNLGWARLRLRPVDLAKIGRLYLQHGRWGDRQVVPAEWVRESTTNQQPTGTRPEASRYGYLWWTKDSGPDPAFAAVGYGGQRIEVVPEKGLVVVVSSHAEPGGTGVPESQVDEIVEAVAGAVSP